MSTVTKAIAMMLIAYGMFTAIDATYSFNNYRASIPFDTSAVQVAQVAAEIQLKILMGIAYLLASIAIMLQAVASDIKDSKTDAADTLGDTQAVQPPIVALKDNAWGVRRTAANALTKIGTNEALAAVKAAAR